VTGEGFAPIAIKLQLVLAVVPEQNTVAAVAAMADPER
jgi:hypothetical protein